MWTFEHRVGGGPFKNSVHEKTGWYCPSLARLRGPRVADLGRALDFLFSAVELHSKYVLVTAIEYTISR